MGGGGVNYDSIKSPIFVHCLLVCVVIFSVCVIIDFIRRLLFRAIKLDEKVDKITKKLPIL